MPGPHPEAYQWLNYTHPTGFLDADFLALFAKPSANGFSGELR
jgi:hypothetical protein